ncbi:CPBP family intramembrane glutamic endopeptidase [Microbacterium sp. SA39]|uniref:CPBP family intramembrane glutamic endopeptidase n=1 Tax=Microbacterium sp. SA39 TaxID=1263625 RepID=UPI0005F9F5C3|nr:CPBP family intramembrane glutamic endopeptidase [Microbacterium sp. SA39]KJQ55464.1 CAAX amino terminal protease self- immunity [Microbacterium sp. SA39]
MSYRVKPRLWMALPVAVLLALISMLGVPLLLSSWTNDPSRIWMVLVAICLTVLLVFVPVFAALGWLRPTLFDPQRVRNVGLFVLSMSPMIVLAVWIAFGGYGDPQGLVIPIILSALQAALWEEFVWRGATVFLLRTRLAEIWVALIPAALFGVMHLTNLSTGKNLGDTIYQVFYATLFGLAMYAIRRVTGSIFVGVLVHFLNNSVTELFYFDDAPVLYKIGDIPMTLPDLIMDSSLVVGAITAIIIALRYPRVPVLPTPDVGFATRKNR